MRIVAIVLLALLPIGCADRSANEALGTLERDRIVLKATASEIILDEPIPEGTMVAAGTLLVQLDDARQQERGDLLAAHPLRVGLSQRLLDG